MTCRVAGFHQISNHFFFNSCGMAVIQHPSAKRQNVQSWPVASNAAMLARW